MMRDLDEADLRREAAELYETVIKERDMKVYRRDGLFYDDEPVRRINPWIAAAVVGAICLGMTMAIVFHELARR